jgi:hypothetical protein
MLVTRETAARGRGLPDSRSPTRLRTLRPDVPRAEKGYDEDALRSFFTLTPEDLALVRTARTARNQLGLALLLAWTRAELPSASRC